MEKIIAVLTIADFVFIVIISVLASRVNRLEAWCKALGSQCNSLTKIAKDLAGIDATIVEAIHGINTVLDIRADVGR